MRFKKQVPQDRYTSLDQIQADATDLLARAHDLYREHGEEIDEKSETSRVVEYEGKAYVILQDSKAVRAAYKIDPKDGELKRQNRPSLIKTLGEIDLC